MTEATRYEIIDEIGRGGMATIFRAYDEVAEMEVVLKVIHEHLMEDEGMVEAFRREAALMQKIDHPGVVRVHGMTDVDGRPAIVMDYCEGGDLRQRLLTHGPMREADALGYFADILDALEAIHEQGVIHRDIKPQNVMFDAQGEIKLIDFGIGQAQELMEADESGQVGTVEYMAPERVDGFAVDGRSDLYSAAVMLFEMVCGHVPYQGNSAAAVMRMHRQAPVPDPKLFVAHLSPRIREAMMRGLAKHPEERFAGARQMKAFLDGEDEGGEGVEDHPRWSRLKREYNAQAWMAAPVEEEGHEWVLFSTDRWESEAESLKVFVDAVSETVDDYERFLTAEPPNKELQHGASLTIRDRLRWARRAVTMDPGKYRLMRAVYLDEVDSAGIVQDGVQRFMVARGLSRAGADKLMEDFEERGVRLRYARLPRHSRQQRGSRFLLDNGVAGTLLLSMGFYLLVGIMPCLFDAEMNLPAPIIYGGLLAWAVMLAIGLALLPTVLRRKSSHRPESSLLDFCLADEVDEEAHLVRMSHLQLAGEIQSPRVAASYKRGLNLSLHLADILDEQDFDGRSRARSLIAGLTDIGRRIIDLEHQVAALQPGQLASRIRRLDLQIAAEEDLDRVEDLMAKKRGLREQLEQRDQDQIELEGMAQRLLEMVGRLEEMVSTHRLRRGDSDDENDEKVVLDLNETLDGLSAEIEELATHRKTQPATAVP